MSERKIGEGPPEALSVLIYRRVKGCGPLELIRASAEAATDVNRSRWVRALKAFAWEQGYKAGAAGSTMPNPYVEAYPPLEVVKDEQNRQPGA